MKRSFLQSVARCLLPLLMLLAAGLAWADPPSRVARLAYVSGAASFSPGGERDWSRAMVNRPLVTGDRLWVDRGARAELQLGVAAVRLGPATSLTVLNLDDRVTQLELSQGILNIRVRRLDRDEVFEVATPNLAYSIRRPGTYRVEVDPQGDSTLAMVRQGQAQVFGEGRAFIIGERRGYRFYDTSLRDFDTFALRAPDELERWSAERDRRWDVSPSRRYVSSELIGFEDLDRAGTWRSVPELGNVWFPSQVAADWAPYRDGHWAWVEPWGWTWVDDAAWGFAPSHYGRWARVQDTWAWVPGPSTARAVYAPALVAFVSSPQSGGTVSWFPLGPRDVYRPAYSASRDYFYSVNASNARVDRGQVERYYVQRNEPVQYSNQLIPGAIIGMAIAAFAQSQPVARQAVRVAPEVAARAPVVSVAPVAPQRAAVMGGAPADARPPERAAARPAVAQAAPPPLRPSFETRAEALRANAGKPLEPAAVAAMKPAVPVGAPPVKVVPATEAVAAPAAAPPRPANAPARPGRPGAPDAAPGAPAVPATTVAPAVPATPATPAPTTTPPPAAPAPAPKASPAPAAAAAPAASAATPPAASEPTPGRPRPGRAAREERPATASPSAVPASPATPAAPAAGPAAGPGARQAAPVAAPAAAPARQPGSSASAATGGAPRPMRRAQAASEAASGLPRPGN